MSRWSVGPRTAALGMTIALVALIATSLVPVAGAVTRRPPCTRRALQAGLGRGTAKVSHATVARPFGCADGWAYAAVDSRRFTATSLFRAHGARWATVVRTTPCERREVPRRIRHRACDSN